MEKKTIFLELPVDIIDELDRKNVMGDRSLFISDLLNKQLQQEVSTMNFSSKMDKRMKDVFHDVGASSGSIRLIDDKGTPIGDFDINTVEGFEQLLITISEISEDPNVRMRAKGWHQI